MRILEVFHDLNVGIKVGLSIWILKPAQTYCQFLVHINHFMVDSKFMLEGIFGNKTAEKVLFHIFHCGESHASGIANDFDVGRSFLKEDGRVVKVSLFDEGTSMG